MMRKIAPKVDAHCRYCGQIKPISVVALAKSYAICTECQRLPSRKGYVRRIAAGKPSGGPQMPREYHREYAKSYSERPDVKQARRLRFQERQKDPVEQVKHAARMQTRNAIRRGDLVRKPCEVCGHEPAQAHHDDYSKPLDIRWLCPVHHHEHHSKAQGTQS